MAKQIIPQNTMIKPLVETHYVCPVKECKRDLGVVTEEEAMSHVNQPILYLPKGFSCLHNSSIVLIGHNDYPNDECFLDESHSATYLSYFFDRHGGDYTAVRSLGAKTLFEGFLSGDSSFLETEEFGRFHNRVNRLVTNRDSAMYHKEDIVPVRTTPELEEMLARMKAEKK